MIAINAAMANQLNEFRASVEKLMEEGVGKDEAIFRLLKETIIASEPIRFEGDGYSEEWKQEAARRGLTNICHVPEALMHYVDNQSKSVLIGERIFNETELNSRLEVELEKYTMKVQIEGRHQPHRADGCHLPEPAIGESLQNERNLLSRRIRSIERRPQRADSRNLTPGDFHQSIGTRNDRSPKSCQSQRQLQRESIRIRRKSTSLS